MTADPGYTKFNVELLPPTGGGSSLSLFDSGKQQDRLRPIFALLLRRSSGHHPLLAGALREWCRWPSVAGRAGSPELLRAGLLWPGQGAWRDGPCH